MDPQDSKIFKKNHDISRFLIPDSLKLVNYLQKKEPVQPGAPDCWDTFAASLAYMYKHPLFHGQNSVNNQMQRFNIHRPSKISIWPATPVQEFVGLASFTSAPRQTRPAICCKVASRTSRTTLVSARAERFICGLQISTCVSSIRHIRRL